MSDLRLPWNPDLPWFGQGSPCVRTNRVNITFPEFADCRECDMCGGCETHGGCLTDLNHLDWFMQFASPGETPCGQDHAKRGIKYVCAKPAGHGGAWHMARTGDGWPNARPPSRSATPPASTTEETNR